MDEQLRYNLTVASRSVLLQFGFKKKSFRFPERLFLLRECELKNGLFFVLTLFLTVEWSCVERLGKAYSAFFLSVNFLP